MPIPKCPNCTLEITVINDTICCDKCKKKYHHDCTNLTAFEITCHKKNEYKPWKCITCIDKYCNKCNKTFPKSNFESICCDKCSRWYHKKCTNLSISEFNSYLVNEDKIWKCSSCLDKYCKKCDISMYRKLNIICDITKNAQA